ncbi:PASTA domain-containing protein [Proteiniclasticum sp. BAD-10]|uniref:PASTA domain-containing protein n=1 Tax=Proteiniclasticum sediminis TaxID=2804028 RepID=A0A941HPP5_9CLOT|nr:PASTA domain-containing protein [Proteiniclasticum sediminis]MBR0575651.1 PASTA domain-containing protein [Proteiniclasticum sediminis]
MRYKGMAIVIFTVTTAVFIFGMFTYQQELKSMLAKEITPVVLKPEPLEPAETLGETPVETASETPVESPSEPEKIKVPSLYGLLQDDALEILEDLGLVADPHYEYHDTAKTDYVFWQIPAKDVELKVGATVSYSVSKGPRETVEEPVSEEKVLIPNLIGLTEQEAKTKLLALDLEVGVERAYKNESNRAEKGIVWSQNWKVGAEAPKGTRVVIRVSLGEEPQAPETSQEPGEASETP